MSDPPDQESIARWMADPDPALVDRWLEAGQEGCEAFIVEMVAAGRDWNTGTMTADDYQNVGAILAGQRQRIRLEEEMVRATSPELFEDEDEDGAGG